MKLIYNVMTGLCVSACVTLAQPLHQQDGNYPVQEETAKKSDISHEFNTEYSYSAKSKLKQGSFDCGKMDAQNFHGRYILSYPVTDGVFLRLGANYEQFSFSTPSAAPGTNPEGNNVAVGIPNTLRSVAPVIGADIELSDNWIMRVETEPGFYSDFQDISIDDVNIPTVIGASYLVDKDLQWFFGLSIDPRRDFMPVMPGFGVRWHFADQWTLMMVLPNPQIQYEINKDLMAFVGASIKGGNYQVAKDFGTTRGRTDLDNDNVSYREIRTGGGVKWKFMKGFEAAIEGGWTVDRRFEYAQEDLSYHSKGAPYGQIGITASF